MGKYSDGYFEHWLAMFIANGIELTKKDILNQIDLYKEFEGDEEFKKLKLEVKEIISNKDLIIFLKYTTSFDVSLKLEDLEYMTHLILA